MVAHNVPACWMVLLMCVLCCRWAACHSCHSMSCSVLLVWHFICMWIDAMCTRTDMFHRSHPPVTTWVCRRILIHGLCLFGGLSVLGTSQYLYHPCKSLPTQDSLHVLDCEVWRVGSVLNKFCRSIILLGVCCHTLCTTLQLCVVRS